MDVGGEGQNEGEHTHLQLEQQHEHIHLQLVGKGRYILTYIYIKNPLLGQHNMYKHMQLVVQVCT